jgi:dienelactone hydrolase
MRNAAVAALLLLAACAADPAGDEAPGFVEVDIGGQSILVERESPAARDDGAGTPAGAARVSVRDVEYRDGDTVLRGRLALPERSPDGTHPAVLVVHEWWGRTKHSDGSAEELARLGYVGLAVDMYGEGRTTTDAEEAGKWAGAIRKDPETMRRRLRAALDFVRSLPETDDARVACIGYCFGGTMSLEAAWAGLDLRAVVSFHGSLTAPKPEDAAGIRASVLVLHGADDTLVSEESIDALQSALREARCDWQFVSYGGAVHSFTNPSADGSRSPVVRYDERAARRSWEAMRDFLAERFASPPPAPR